MKKEEPKIKIGFLGAGRMAEGLMEAIIGRDSQFTAADVIMADREWSRRRSMTRKFGVEVTTDLRRAAESDLIFLAVRPQDVEDVAAVVTPTLHRNQTLISIVAGKTLQRLREIFGMNVGIVRVMPNLAVRVGAGMCAYCPAPRTLAKHVTVLTEILSKAGAAVRLSESDFNAVTALSGSGPAYFAYMEQAMAEGGVALGLRPEVARLLAEQTMFGTARFLCESGMDLKEFIAGICTPGGTTAAGMKKLIDPRFKKIVQATLEAAAKRSEELGR